MHMYTTVVKCHSKECFHRIFIRLRKNECFPHNKLLAVKCTLPSPPSTPSAPNTIHHTITVDAMMRRTGDRQRAHAEHALMYSTIRVFVVPAARFAKTAQTTRLRVHAHVRTKIDNVLSVCVCVYVCVTNVCHGRTRAPKNYMPRPCGIRSFDRRQNADDNGRIVHACAQRRETGRSPDARVWSARTRRLRASANINMSPFMCVRVCGLSGLAGW